MNNEEILGRMLDRLQSMSTEEKQAMEKRLLKLIAEDEEEDRLEESQETDEEARQRIVTSKYEDLTVEEKLLQRDLQNHPDMSLKEARGLLDILP